MTVSGTTRLGADRFVVSSGRPENARTTVHELQTSDGAAVAGVLSTVPGATSVVTIMHPRRDVTHHALVPHLLQAGHAVWTQHPRSVNNDLHLLHEQALLDVAAGQCFLRDTGFEHLTTLGHSGGGPLFAYYLEQAALQPDQRIHATPGGRPVPLADTDMPLPDAALFLAPHPGQGLLLLGCIDPAVIDEHDPLATRADLDLYDPANGFVEPPTSSSYDDEFLSRYRAAQRDRVARIDAIARHELELSAASRTRHNRTGDPADRRAVLATRVLITHRTDADPRCVDLSIDPNDRPYGSVFGRRPDLINYGRIGFGRLTTPEAWLSTWSGLSSLADFERCGPGVTVPTLFVELTGDQACFPAESRRMFDALGANDKTYVSVRGTHFGGALSEGEPAGIEGAAAEMLPWLADRTLQIP